MSAASCGVCGFDFENDRRPGCPSRFRCGTCGQTVCLDCHLFDVDGRRACVTCYRSGRATVVGISVTR